MRTARHSARSRDTPRCESGTEVCAIPAKVVATITAAINDLDSIIPGVSAVLALGNAHHFDRGISVQRIRARFSWKQDRVSRLEPCAAVDLLHKVCSLTQCDHKLKPALTADRYRSTLSQ